MLRNEYPLSFRVKLHQKDLNMAMETEFSRKTTGPVLALPCIVRFNDRILLINYFQSSVLFKLLHKSFNHTCQHVCSVSLHKIRRAVRRTLTVGLFKNGKKFIKCYVVVPLFDHLAG